MRKSSKCRLIGYWEVTGLDDYPYTKHSRLGVILFVAGFIGILITAMASDSGALSTMQVWALAAVGSLVMGTGAVLAE